MSQRGKWIGLRECSHSSARWLLPLPPCPLERLICKGNGPQWPIYPDQRLEISVLFQSAHGCPEHTWVCWTKRGRTVVAVSCWTRSLLSLIITSSPSLSFSLLLLPFSILLCLHSCQHSPLLSLNVYRSLPLSVLSLTTISLF